MASTAKDLILVLGVASRSGTNLMRDLLVQHKACTTSTIHEDYFIAKAKHLAGFASSINVGGKSWLIESETMGVLGNALRAYLWSKSVPKPGAQFLVNKTPRVDGLEFASVLLPGVPIVFMIRDVRDVVHSAYHSFGRAIEETSHRWTRGVRTAYRYAAQNPTTTQLVHFEDLVQKREKTLMRVCDNLGLPTDHDSIDWAKVRDLPVRGSSDLVRLGGELHWKAQPSSTAFQPVGRWRDLPSQTIERVEGIAQTSMLQAGYTLATNPT